MVTIVAELFKAEAKKGSMVDREYILTFKTHDPRALAIAMTPLQTTFKLTIEEEEGEA